MKHQLFVQFRSLTLFNITVTTLLKRLALCCVLTGHTEAKWVCRDKNKKTGHDGKPKMWAVAFSVVCDCSQFNYFRAQSQLQKCNIFHLSFVLSWAFLIPLALLSIPQFPLRACCSAILLQHIAVVPIWSCFRKHTILNVFSYKTDLKIKHW